MNRDALRPLRRMASAGRLPTAEDVGRAMVLATEADCKEAADYLHHIRQRHEILRMSNKPKKNVFSFDTETTGYDIYLKAPENSIFNGMGVPESVVDPKPKKAPKFSMVHDGLSVECTLNDAADMQAVISQWATQYSMQYGQWTTAGNSTAPIAETKANLVYPGITSERRVVLDLSYCGYRMSGEIVAKNGELLGIADPAAKYDPVPGAIIATMPLGLALEKLVAAGAKFDLIVCELPTDGVTPRVGAFAPPRPPLATSGRRLILPGRVAVKPAVGNLDLSLAVWRATQKLLSDRGEALIGMHVIAYNNLHKMKEPGLERVWGAHVERDNVRAYLHRGNTLGCKTTARAPVDQDRCSQFHYNQINGAWTKGQRDIFTKTLLPK